MRAWVPKGRAGAVALVAFGYLAALAAGAATYLLLPNLGEWWRLAAADAVATAVIFAFSVAVDNSSFYDPYWSVAPVPIAVWLALQASGAPLARRVLVVALISLWAARLTWNWLRGWGGFHHEDWRYVDLRHKTGGAYWVVSFFGLHFMPTVTVFLALLALGPALGGAAPLGPIDAVAFAVTFGAILIEAIADEQLRAFRRRPRVEGSILDTGLWAWSRHPNYLGEISFWWGLFLFGLAGTRELVWWTLPGPLWMTTMFVFISVPLLDKRSLLRRPEYAAHMKAVPGILPRPWRRAARRG